MSTEPKRRRFRIPAFWQAVVVVVAAWLLFDNAFPPVMPRTLMIQYMLITIVGTLLYFSFDDARWTEFKAPVLALLRADGLWPARWVALVAFPLLVAWVTYDAVRPRMDAPVELRQVHPAPPSTLRVYGKKYDLGSLKNPLLSDALKAIRANPDTGMVQYRTLVDDGAALYFQNCFVCHGDQLNGEGHFAKAFDPLPANFQDVGTIAQLQEGYLFWRITTGGPGLPKEGTPWNSAMPVWHELLKEDEVWKIITFLYDYVGQVPRMWDQERSKAVTGLKEQVQSQRAKDDAKAIYRQRCAVCHGETGSGDGPAAEFLYPRPRDFSLGLFKYKTSPGTQLPRDEDLFNTIKVGLAGTAMPGWSKILSDEQIRSLIPVVKRFDITSAWAPEDAPDEAFDDEGHYIGKNLEVIQDREPETTPVASSQASLQRGKERFLKVCAKCHGEEGRGNITSGKKLADDWEYRIWPRDLTKPWTWRSSNVSGGADSERDRAATIRRIYERLSIGIPGTPMPAHRAVEAGNKDPLSLEDRWNVANYVYSLREGAAPAPRAGALIRAARIEGAVPKSAADERWDKASATTLRLAPNVIKEDRLFTPLADAVTVRALYNAKEIAFLLEIDDRTDSRPGEKTSEQIQDENLKLFSDAIAIQFPQEGAWASVPVVEKPLYRHGDRAHPTTIWYWNAGSVMPEQAPRSVLLDAQGPDKPLSPRQNSGNPLMASGEWSQGRWRIVMQRTRRSGDSKDVEFNEGRFIPISFANWDGSNGESGSRHTLTSWYWLVLPPELDSLKVYGSPFGTGLLTFFAGLLLVRKQRRRA